MSHVDESCHIVMRHVARMDGPCHTHEFVTSQQFAPGTAAVGRKWVMSHMYESYHTHEFVTSQEFAPGTAVVGREWHSCSQC